MERELRSRRHELAREVSVDVFYKGEPLGRQRLDMVVDRKVVVEIKSSIELSPTAIMQTLCYLRTTRLEVGLLLHFGPKARIKRLVSRKDVALRLTTLHSGPVATEDACIQVPKSPT